MAEDDTNPKSAKAALDRILSSGKLQAVGMAWFNEADYPEVLRIMKDADRLPRTYAQWRQNATNGEQKLAAQGVKVLRAVINPQDFVGWCKARGLDVDAKARMTFASEYAARQIGM